jgi:hypothetical protein
MSQTKCIHCDGLGYFYNQSTFQSEHCPHCDGKGYIETVSHDLGGPVEVPEMPLVVEAPKAPKKTTKPVVEETPVAVAEPTTPIVPVFETQTQTSGSDAK